MSIDEHKRQLADLHDVFHKQEVHLAKLDAVVDGVLSSKGTVATSSSGLARIVDFLDALSGQAKAIEDLDIVVRDELRASRKLAEDATSNVADDRVMQQLAERVSAQGEAIERINLVLADISAKFACRPSPSAPAEPGRDASKHVAERGADEQATCQASAMTPLGCQECDAGSLPQLARRFSELEDTVDFIQHHLYGRPRRPDRTGDDGDGATSLR